MYRYIYIKKKVMVTNSTIGLIQSPSRRTLRGKATLPCENQVGGVGGERKKGMRFWKKWRRGGGCAEY